MDPAGRTLHPLSIAVLLVVALAVAPVAGTPGADRLEVRGPVSQGLSGGVDADNVVMYVDLQPDGSADWRVEYRIRLDDDNDTAAFEDIRADIESDPASYRNRFAEGIRRTVRDAENATGREMEARNFAVGTETRQLPNEYGIVYYTFEWTNFAATDDGTIRAGDALAGLFLDAETTLQFGWPEGYELADVAPEPTTTQSRAVSWTGSLNFADGEPSLIARASTTARATESTTAPATTHGADDAGGGVPSWLLVAALVLAAVPVAAVWFARRRGGQEAPEPETESSQPADGPPDELLSNEERVLKLLEDHGGRIKQQEIVETLGWTDAKTSQVVGKLREEGEIEVFRLGRENVLTLPDEEL